ncbi:MAG: SRPBCC domain-containing protein [Rhodospirillales bacterium]|nr:SRPBCC domain-containing protein [Rhodospirillales bacterium]
MIDVAPAIMVRREIKAPAADLFDAWLDPELLAQWMRPGDFAPARVKNDPRVGGSFEISMQSACGDGILHTGVYRKIDRPRVLVFTWISVHTQERETLVTVTFNRRGPSATEIVITHEMLPTADAASKHAGGWGSLLEKLAGLKG